jgi:hypothetical protein
MVRAAQCLLRRTSIERLRCNLIHKISNCFIRIEKGLRWAKTCLICGIYSAIFDVGTGFKRLTAHTVVFIEPSTDHIFFGVDVAQVSKSSARHPARQFFKIQGAEFIPFCQDDH